MGGADTLFGGDGNDLLIGDFRAINGPAALGLPGNDSIDGGLGADVIAGDYIDITLTLVGAALAAANDTIVGGDGIDTIYGDAKTGNASLVDAGAGFADTINGAAGTADTAQAGPGTDTCTNVETTTGCEP
ncbi:hypothetical protein ADK67_14815 [Saccharothrix sp. NRRL B-16348]|uniref:hypothetical protein n=1 Tax=Saccharothrix sp. NRRL B-16348 TaxID=1415542 RepID=UPI0006AE4E57|nr:hypothetical protein [Saccharothrix sp. NRRL B-16348]KOX27087.1 hypothetical protein ADK67_14815 [Saccharothrix sp. NRRL B-16348]